MINFKAGQNILIHFKKATSIVNQCEGDINQLDFKEIIKKIKESLILEAGEGPRKAFNSKYLEVKKKNLMNDEIIDIDKDRKLTERSNDFIQSQEVLMTLQNDQIIENTKGKRNENRETQPAEIEEYEKEEEEKK